MQKSKIPEIFNVLLFDGFSNLCLANLIEPMRAANDLSGETLYAWRFFSIEGGSVESSSGLSVSPVGVLGRETGNVLVVMPSYGFASFANRQTSRALRSAAGRHRMIAGLDTGSWLLANTGLLEGRRATIHWEELSRFEEAFPGVIAVRERFVIDDRRITCSGAMATFDLMSWLIRSEHGPLLSLEIAQLLMNQHVPESYALPHKSDGSLTNRVLNLMQRNLEAPLQISEIARRVGCSQRKLETHILSDLGAVPNALYRRLRLNLARKLALETDLSVAEISGRCGYENSSAMTRAFRAEFGLTPSAVRMRG